MSEERIFGGIEGGGTKFVCAVGTGPDNIIAEERFATTTPGETLGRTIEFFKSQPPVAAVGIGTFGPVDPDPRSPEFGSITSTPKPGWANYNIAARVKEELGVPVAFDTDVNAAAFGEYTWGVGQGLDCILYLTVGTGIGGGGLINGQPMHGLIHPEMGHLRIPQNPEEDKFEGICPYHGNCLEGLASGKAMEARWGVRAQKLDNDPDHPAWDLEAKYLALGIQNMILILSPQRIIIGGGIMNQPTLFPRVRAQVQQLLNNYVQSPAILKNIDDYIVPPQLGNKSGVLGAIAMAKAVVNA